VPAIDPVLQHEGDDAIAGDARAEARQFIVVEDPVALCRWDERQHRLLRQFHAILPLSRVATVSPQLGIHHRILSAYVSKPSMDVAENMEGTGN